MLDLIEVVRHLLLWRQERVRQRLLAVVVCDLPGLHRHHPIYISDEASVADVLSADKFPLDQAELLLHGLRFRLCVRMNGSTVTDLNQPVPPGSIIVISHQAPQERVL